MWVHWCFTVVDDDVVVDDYDYDDDRVKMMKDKY